MHVRCVRNGNAALDTNGFGVGLGVGMVVGMGVRMRRADLAGSGKDEAPISGARADMAISTAATAVTARVRVTLAVTGWRGRDERE